jgi:pilus assembly protein CpaB
VTARRRRGLLLLCVALASGGLAASQVHERERRATERLGPQVDVLVAARDIAAGARVVRGALGVRRVPARFVPPDALPSAEAVVGARTAAPVAEGGYLTASLFAGGGESEDGRLRRGERAVTVEVAAGSGIADLPPGHRVDVLVSTETGAAGGRTTMALPGVELLSLGPGTHADPQDVGNAAGRANGTTAAATLRVTLRQAVYLTAADNFAHEIRLLARPAGDHSTSAPVTASGL